jgi:catechol-2,3-dioxygenase
MASPRKLAHVVYCTRRFDEMFAWYQTVFEAKIQHQNPVMGFLTFDDEHHRFGIINLSALDPDGVDDGQRSAVGVNHVAYTFDGLGDLLDTYARLKDAGVTPYWPVHHGLTLSLYYRDPDGNGMEFQVDACETMEESNSFIRGGAMHANPIGVAFDPDDLLKRYRDGVPVKELLVQPAGPVADIPELHLS